MEAVKHLRAKIGVRDVEIVAKPAVGFRLGYAHGTYRIENCNRAYALDPHKISGRERRDSLSQLDKNIREIRRSRKPRLPGAIKIPGGNAPQVGSVLVRGVVAGGI